MLNISKWGLSQQLFLCICPICICARSSLSNSRYSLSIMIANIVSKNRYFSAVLGLILVWPSAEKYLHMLLSNLTYVRVVLSCSCCLFQSCSSSCLWPHIFSFILVILGALRCIIIVIFDATVVITERTLPNSPYDSHKVVLYPKSV